MILDFLSSDIWRDMQNKVFGTFALTGAGTVANAIEKPVQEISVQQSFVQQLTEIFALISYGLSIIVAITVIYKFFIWIKERKKEK